jgi:hypothetical protein
MVALNVQKRHEVLVSRRVSRCAPQQPRRTHEKRTLATLVEIPLFRSSHHSSKPRKLVQS